MNAVTTAPGRGRKVSPVNIAELMMVEFSDPQRWWSMLATARTFRRYSAMNQLWLAAQDASGIVASARTWQTTAAMGGGTCRVADDARGVSILAPMSFATPARSLQIMTVFEDNQLVAPPDLPALATPAAITGTNACQHLWTAIVALLCDDGWTVEIRPRSQQAVNSRTSLHDRTVTISDDITLGERVRAVLHAWAHIALDKDHGTSVSGDVREIEARSVAHLVGVTVGLGLAISDLDLGAIGELEVAAVTAAAERVLGASQRLTEDLENELGIDLSPDLLATPRHTRPFLTGAFSPTPGVGRSCGGVPLESLSSITAASTAPHRRPHNQAPDQLVVALAGRSRAMLSCVSHTETSP